MPDTGEFSFRDSSVAESYDTILGPVLFEPWADRMIREHQPWQGRRVLDLATGTGIVAERLAKSVGPNGSVTAADINVEMLAIAAKRCKGLTPTVSFLENPADALDISDESLDVVVCQQGLQFFPDRRCAVQEILRVLDSGGRVVATTWCPVSECQFFGAVCEALETVGESEISTMMRVPFDHMSGDELYAHFDSAGFTDVKLQRQEQDMVLPGGMDQAIQLTYATPIGPKLKALSGQKQSEFQATLGKLLAKISPDGCNMGRMVTNAVSAAR